MTPELLLLPFAAGIASGAILWLTSWLEFRQVKSGSDSHWTERAREQFPVLQSARTNLWSVPTVVALILAWSFPTPKWMDVANWFAGLAGAMVGTRPLDRWRGHHLPFRRWCRHVLGGWLPGLAGWFVLVAGVVLMPAGFGPLVVAVFLGALALHVALALGAGIWVSERLGWMHPATPEVIETVRRLAAANGQRPPRVLQVESTAANAMAVAGGSYVLLLGPLTSLLTPAELETVLAHELSHTREGWGVVLGRVVGSLWLFPWIVVRPLAAAVGIMAPVLLAFGTLGILKFNRWLNLRFEHRADAAAVESQESAGIYARALLKLHEFNLLPATLEKKSATHPDLYDRMIAAGVDPGFPRPQPAASLGWGGRLFSILVGPLAIWTVINWLENGGF